MIFSDSESDEPMRHSPVFGLWATEITHLASESSERDDFRAYCLLSKSRSNRGNGIYSNFITRSRVPTVSVRIPLLTVVQVIIFCSMPYQQLAFAC